MADPAQAMAPPAADPAVAQAMALAELLAQELILVHRLLRLSGRLPKTMAALDLISLGVRDLRVLVAAQPHRPVSVLTR